MPERKAAALKGRLPTAKERVIKRSTCRNIRRSLSASNGLHDKINHGAVGIGLSGKWCRADVIRVMASVASNQQRHWNQCHFSRRDGRIEDIIQFIQVLRVISEIGHGMGVGNDESGGSARDSKSG